MEPQGHGWKKEQFEREIPKMTTFIFNNSVFFLEVSKNKGVVVIINMDKNRCQKVHGRVFCLMTQLKKEHEVFKKRKKLFDICPNEYKIYVHTNLKKIGPGNH